MSTLKFRWVLDADQRNRAAGDDQAGRGDDAGMKRGDRSAVQGGFEVGVVLVRFGRRGDQGGLFGGV
jgi:hypothetical protein